MRKALFALTFASLFAFATQSAHAALNSYLQLRGSKTAKFNTSVPSGWYQALCTNEVISGIVSPRDSASGQATGKRQHKPFRVRMYYDQASTRSLKNAFATKEPIPMATIFLHRPVAAKGSEQVYMQIKLENVQITSYQLGVLDGKPALTLTLQYDKASHTPVAKTVLANAWKQGFTLGG